MLTSKLLELLNLIEEVFPKTLEFPRTSIILINGNPEISFQWKDQNGKPYGQTLTLDNYDGVDEDITKELLIGVKERLIKRDADGKQGSKVNKDGSYD